MNLPVRSMLKVILAIAIPCLAGCVQANFTEPITSFQDSINTSAASVTTYYTELNSFERELYLRERLYDATLTVDATDKDGQKTALLHHTFRPESIKARTDAITLLGVYAKRLAELAGSTAPATFNDNTTALGKNLSGLAGTFRSLAGDDKTASDYAGPIGTIVGVVGQMYLEHQRDVAVKKAIESGAPAVRTVLDLLEADLVNVIEPLRTTGLKETIAMQVLDYNTKVDDASKPKAPPFTVDERRKRLDDIRVAAERYDAMLAATPTDFIQGIREAHESLVKYAQSSHSPEDLAALNSALETFSNRVKTVAAAVKQLQNLAKETRS